MRHVANSAVILGAAASLTAALACAAPPPAADAGEPIFRQIYRELVETNTALSAGSCTVAAAAHGGAIEGGGILGRRAAPVRGAGPSQGRRTGRRSTGGSDPKLKAVLLLAHIDVVEAKREDWTRDPFTLVEENGNFYARGAIDDKAEAAIWVDTLVRLRQEKFRPRRTLKLALTCGEETAGAFNGAEWLVNKRRDLIDAAFAINEGAFGELIGGRQPHCPRDPGGRENGAELPAGGDQSGRPQFAARQGQCHLPSGRGAHAASRATSSRRSSRTAVAPTSREWRRSRPRGATPMPPPRCAPGSSDPHDAAAIALVSAQDPSWNATLRTTCVATMLEAGHATNALPQRARANINCRIFPGVSAGSRARRSSRTLVADPAGQGHHPETSAARVPRRRL